MYFSLLLFLQYKKGTYRSVDIQRSHEKLKKCIVITISGIINKKEPRSYNTDQLYRIFEMISYPFFAVAYFKN